MKTLFPKRVKIATISLTICISIASSEGFSKLKPIKTRLRSSSTEKKTLLSDENLAPAELSVNQLEKLSIYGIDGLEKLEFKL